MPVLDKQTEEQILRLANEEARRILPEVVQETLTQMGIDTSNPIEMQRDFQHLRDWRRAGESVKGKSTVFIILSFITGIGGLILLGFSAWLKNLTGGG